jgi:hypothetical protein
MDIKDGHMRPLPTANNSIVPLTETILFDTNKIKFVPKIMLSIITNFSSENFLMLYARQYLTLDKNHYSTYKLPIFQFINKNTKSIVCKRIQYKKQSAMYL